jgi:serine/threonine protein phosphatase 1
VDRGPDSRGVLERLVRNPFPTHFVALKGNHEQLFEAFLQDADAGGLWCANGGIATLRSYGVEPGARLLDHDFEGPRDMLRQALPQAHREFLGSLKLALSLDRYFLCHAGIRPGVRLERQRAEDLLWIRNEFLNSTMDFGKLVIHGHTPGEQPEVRPNRINIDTGAFATGRLTCLVLDGDSRRFLST